MTDDVYFAVADAETFLQLQAHSSWPHSDYKAYLSDLTDQMVAAVRAEVNVLVGLLDYDLLVDFAQSTHQDLDSEQTRQEYAEEYADLDWDGRGLDVFVAGELASDLLTDLLDEAEASGAYGEALDDFAEQTVDQMALDLPKGDSVLEVSTERGGYRIELGLYAGRLKADPPSVGVAQTWLAIASEVGGTLTLRTPVSTRDWTIKDRKLTAA